MIIIILFIIISQGTPLHLHLMYGSWSQKWHFVGRLSTRVGSYCLTVVWLLCNLPPTLTHWWAWFGTFIYTMSKSCLRWVLFCSQFSSPVTSGLGTALFLAFVLLLSTAERFVSAMGEEEPSCLLWVFLIGPRTLRSCSKYYGPAGVRPG